MSQTVSYYNFLNSREYKLLPDDEITSTEQLLTLIRNNDVQNDVNKETIIPETTSLVTSQNVDSESGHVSIGIDIRENELIFVKIGSTTKKSWTLLDCASYNISDLETENDTDSQNQITPSRLSQYISKFIGGTKQYRLWAFASSKNADVKHILIPKVQEKQLTNSVFWKAKKEMGFDENSSFFDFEVLGDITQKGISKTSVMVYTIPKEEILSLKELFLNAGYSLTGILTPEFSIQNLLRGDLLSGSGDTIATLSIGLFYSKISLYRRGNLVVTRKIKACLNSMSEALVESIQESYANVMQSDSNFSVEYARNLLLKNISECNQDILEAEDGIDENKIFKGIFPAVKRLVRQIERTFQNYNSLFKEDVITHLYIEGLTSRFVPLNQFISDELEINVSSLNVIEPGVPQFIQYKEDNPTIPGEFFSPAIGLAMSDYGASVPNFLYDYQDKQRISLNTQYNKGIRIGLTIATILCICVLLFQIFESRLNKSEIKRLKEQLTAYGPRVDQNLILKEAALMKNLNKSKKKIADKHLGLATIKEITERTPNYIQLDRIRLDMGPIKEKPRRRSSRHDKRVIIEGNVYKEQAGQRGQDKFETSLANYILLLEKSIMFTNSDVREKEFEHIDRYGEVLSFTLQLQIIQSETDSELEGQ